MKTKLLAIVMLLVASTVSAADALTVTSATSEADMADTWFWVTWQGTYGDVREIRLLVRPLLVPGAPWTQASGSPQLGREDDGKKLSFLFWSEFGARDWAGILVSLDEQGNQKVAFGPFYIGPQ